MTHTSSNDRTTRTPSPQNNSARWIAIAIALPFLALIAAFMIMPFIAKDEIPLQAVGPVAATTGAAQGGIVFRGTANVWEIRGQMTEDTDRKVRFDLQLMGPTGQPPSDDLPIGLTVEPVDASAPAVALSLQVHGMGRYSSVETSLPSAGRWRLRVLLPEVQALFEFDTRL